MNDPISILSDSGAWRELAISAKGRPDWRPTIKNRASREINLLYVLSLVVYAAVWEYAAFHVGLRGRESLPEPDIEQSVEEVGHELRP
jgi:hypothetical protein